MSFYKYLNGVLNFLNVLLCTFLLAFSFCSSNAEAQDASKLIDLSNLFDQNDVVIVGWNHLPENTVVPNFLSSAIKELDPNQFTIVFESSSKFKGSLGWALNIIDSILWVDLKRFQSGASKSGFKVIDGDMSDEERKLALDQIPHYSGTDLSLAFIHIVNELSKKRDFIFAEKIKNALRERPKVLVLIGADHVLHLGSLLANSDLNVVGVKTYFDQNSRDVFVDEKILGRAKRFPKYEMVKKLFLGTCEDILGVLGLTKLLPPQH